MRGARDEIAGIISIHALRGEGDTPAIEVSLSVCISIHALRGEGDRSGPSQPGAFLISIHALRGEGDWLYKQFGDIGFYFNPRPPWGGRLNVSRLHKFAC